MDMSRYSSASNVPFYRLFWLSLNLKTLMSYGLLALVAVNNSIAPAQAQALNQSPSTSPSYVAPKGGITTLDTPSCSNSISFSEYPSGTAITNQYSNKGIVFGGSNPFITTDGANPTSPVLSGSPQFFGAIEGSFVDPRDGVTPATAVNFQLDAGYFDSVGSTALKLYDREGNLIEQRTNTGQGIFRFNIEGLPVAKWRIEPVGDDPAGFAIDNVCFTLRAKQSPRSYPLNLGNDATLESVPDTVSPRTQRYQSEEDYDEYYVDLEETADLEANQAPTDGSSRIKPPDPKDVAKQSCDGIGIPLNVSSLRQIVEQIKPDATDRQIQDAFEAFALDSQDLEKYDENLYGKFPSQERSRKTKGKRSNVVPDAASTVEVIDFAPYGYGPPIPIPYPLSGFWDAKVLPEGKSIRLSESRYQAQGFLDYLSHRSSVALAPVPKYKYPNGHLIYMTTAGARITKGVLNYAGDTPGVPVTPVAVYQIVACIRDEATNGQYTANYLQMGRGIFLNKDRFIEYPELDETLPAGRPSSLIFQP